MTDEEADAASAFASRSRLRTFDDIFFHRPEKSQQFPFFLCRHLKGTEGTATAYLALSLQVTDRSIRMIPMVLSPALTRQTATAFTHT